MAATHTAGDGGPGLSQQRSVPPTPPLSRARREQQVGADEVSVAPSREHRTVGADQVSWRRALLAIICIAALTVVSGAIAHRVALAQAPVYAARVELSYELDEARSGGFLREDRRLVTQVVMISGPTVLQPVADRHGFPFDELSEATTAELLELSEIIRIDVEHEDPTLARELVTEIADEYLALSRNDEIEESRRLVAADLADIEARIEVVNGRLGELTLDLSGQTPVEAQRLLAEHQSLLESRAAAQEQLFDLELAAVDAQPATIFTAPYVLHDPVSPMPLRAAVGGGLVGALIGTILALAITRPRGPLRR